VFNYYFDEDRDGHADTVRLFETIAAGDYVAYTSEYVVRELSNAKEPKRDKMLKLIEKYNITVLRITQESDSLAATYINEGVLTANHRYDCSHIAVASVHGLDCVLSFNYTHINKLRTKERVAVVNAKKDLKGIIICNPLEVLDDEVTGHV